MEILKSTVMMTAVLALQFSRGHLKLDIVTWNAETVCDLLQKQPRGRTKHGGYWSRSITDNEKRYNTTQLECLSFACSVHPIRPYLERNRFTIRSDHDNLKCILSLSDSTDRVAQWQLRPSKFDFAVVHQAGIKKQNFNVTLRLNPTGQDESRFEGESQLYAINNVNSRHTAIHTVAEVGDHTQETQSPYYDHKNTVKTACAQQQDIFCSTSVTRLRQDRCEFTVNK